MLLLIRDAVRRALNFEAGNFEVTADVVAHLEAVPYKVI